MPTVKELREEFARVHTEATKVVEDAIAAGAELTPEVKAENEKRFARLETIKGLIDNSTKFAKLALDNGQVAGPTEPPGKAEVDALEQPATGAKLDRAAFSRAASRWASTGAMDAKFATITTASQSGIMLPVEVAQPLVPSAANTFRAAYGIYGLPVMSTPTTHEINIPVLSATSGGKVAENASSETENAPGLTESIVSKPATYQSGSAWFSNLQLSATDFDLIANTTPALAYSKELALEADAVAAIIADSGITQAVTTAGTAAITYAELVSLDNALPKKFQTMKVILLSATAYAAACAMTFASGPAVLTTDANGIKRFNGTPVLRSDNFQALGAGHVVGAVISLAGFHLRDAGPVNLQRYTQIPAKPNQTGFNLFAYHAYGYAPSAVAKLVNAAS